jgi:hypothetical protein
MRLFERDRALGHMAMHYLPGDEHAARRLLMHLGCTLVDNGPRPGEDGFCTVLLDQGTANHADNILFLSRLSDAQAALEKAIRERLGIGSIDEHPAVAGFQDMRRQYPESTAHVGIRYGKLEALEAALFAIDDDARPGGPLAGRVEVTRYGARPNLDPEVDRRMAVSRAFRGDEPPAFADYWVQCFVRTDLFGYGILAFGQTIELDYVFEPFFSAPPSFGRPRA